MASDFYEVAETELNLERAMRLVWQDICTSVDVEYVYYYCPMTLEVGRARDLLDGVVYTHI